jgi:DNA-binding response OmpR family regulator
METDTELLSPKRILLVEDDALLSSTLKRFLNTVNFEVDVIRRGDEVMPVFEKVDYELVFLDIILPGENGYEILKKIKRTKKGKNTPIIMLSNIGDAMDVERAINLGAADYLIKANTSLEKIKQLLRKHLVHFAARQNMHME